MSEVCEAGLIIGVGRPDPTIVLCTLDNGHAEVDGEPTGWHEGHVLAMSTKPAPQVGPFNVTGRSVESVVRWPAW